MPPSTPNSGSIAGITRKYLNTYKKFTLPCAADIIREQFGIPGCHSVIRLDKEVRRRGEILSYETRYYICSLGRETIAKQIQEMILGHWQIENCLHLAKDKFYGEDKHAFRVPGMGEIWTAMTSMATALMQLMYKGERTLKEVRERFRETPAAALQ